MNVMYYRMVNGYGYYPTAGGAGAQHPLGQAVAPVAAPQPSPVSAVPSPAPAPTAMMAAGANGLGLGAAAGALGLGAAAGALGSAGPMSLTGASAGLTTPKWYFPNFNSTQLQYMLRPRMLKGSRVSKSVKCDTCNITLNSEQQAQQHYSGKNHQRRLKQLSGGKGDDKSGKRKRSTDDPNSDEPSSKSPRRDTDSPDSDLRDKDSEGGQRSTDTPRSRSSQSDDDHEDDSNSTTSASGVRRLRHDTAASCSDSDNDGSCRSAADINSDHQLRLAADGEGRANGSDADCGGSDRDGVVEGTGKTHTSPSPPCSSEGTDNPGGGAGGGGGEVGHVSSPGVHINGDVGETIERPQGAVSQMAGSNVPVSVAPVVTLVGSSHLGQSSSARTATHLSAAISSSSNVLSKLSTTPGFVGYTSQKSHLQPKNGQLPYSFTRGSQQSGGYVARSGMGQGATIYTSDISTPYSMGPAIMTTSTIPHNPTAHRLPSNTPTLTNHRFGLEGGVPGGMSSSMGLPMQLLHGHVGVSHYIPTSMSAPSSIATVTSPLQAATPYSYPLHSYTLPSSTPDLSTLMSPFLTPSGIMSHQGSVGSSVMTPHTPLSPSPLAPSPLTGGEMMLAMKDSADSRAQLSQLTALRYSNLGLADSLVGLPSALTQPAPSLLPAPSYPYGTTIEAMSIQIPGKGLHQSSLQKGHGLLGVGGQTSMLSSLTGDTSPLPLATQTFRTTRASSGDSKLDYAIASQDDGAPASGAGALDPVTQAVLDNAMHKLPTKRKAITIPCTVCDLMFNSDAQASAHFSGKMHSKKAKLTESQSEVRTVDSAVSAKSWGNPFYCQACNVSLNSPGQLDQHKLGIQHKRNEGQRSSSPRSAGGTCNSAGWTETPGQKTGWFQCATCNISVPTAGALQQHIRSKGHIEKIHTISLS